MVKEAYKFSIQQQCIRHHELCYTEDPVSSDTQVAALTLVHAVLCGHVHGRLPQDGRRLLLLADEAALSLGPLSAPSQCRCHTHTTGCSIKHEEQSQTALELQLTC